MKTGLIINNSSDQYLLLGLLFVDTEVVIGASTRHVVAQGSRQGFACI